MSHIFRIKFVQQHLDMLCIACLCVIFTKQYKSQHYGFCVLFFGDFRANIFCFLLPAFFKQKSAFFKISTGVLVLLESIVFINYYFIFVLSKLLKHLKA